MKTAINEMIQRKYLDPDVAEVDYDEALMKFKDCIFDIAESHSQKHNQEAIAIKLLNMYSDLANEVCFDYYNWYGDWHLRVNAITLLTLYKAPISKPLQRDLARKTDFDTAKVMDRGKRIPLIFIIAYSPSFASFRDFYLFFDIIAKNSDICVKFEGHTLLDAIFMYKSIFDMNYSDLIVLRNMLQVMINEGVGYNSQKTPLHYFLAALDNDYIYHNDTFRGRIKEKPLLEIFNMLDDYIGYTTNDAKYLDIYRELKEASKA